MTTTIAPWLSVRHGADALAFYKAAFGAVEVFKIDGDGIVARLSVDGAEFWISDESPEHANFSPESLGGTTARMVLTVADPDAMYARALAAGAHEVQSMSDMHGWRVGRVVDPYGHHWEIGREVRRLDADPGHLLLVPGKGASEPDARYGFGVGVPASRGSLGAAGNVMSS